MLRCIRFVATLAGLVSFASITAAGPSAEGLQQVQSGSKNDNLLLSEISQTVQEWTNRCVRLDRAESMGASECWHHAVAASERFMALGEPFAEQLRQLQAAWLKRAAQIKDSENSSVQAASAIPTLQPGAEAAEPNNQATPSRSTPRLVKAPSKSRPAHSTKKVASATNSVKKAKVTRILRRKQQALKTIKVVKAVPVAVRRPIETYPARKAELRTIRDKLKRIERNLGCTTLKCENKTKGG